MCNLSVTSMNFPLFGAVAVFHSDEDSEIVKDVLLDAHVYAKHLEKIFNFYDPDSELSELNKTRHMRVSDHMLAVLECALEFCKTTAGEYDITHGKRFIARKSGLKSVPDVHCSYKDVLIKDHSVTLTHEDVLLDLGSIAKGYITDMVVEYLLNAGIESGYIDSRGDIRLFGSQRSVGIAHPRKDAVITTIALRDSGIATSGDYRQYAQDFEHSHVLNQKGIISATVIAPSLMLADALASVLMVGDPKTIEDSGYMAMSVDKDLNIRYFNGFEKLKVE